MARLAYFQGWRTDQIARLAAGAKQYILVKNERLIRKGDLLDSLSVLVSGQLRLCIPLPGEGERVISLVGPGESFGESCLILSEACPFDAVASRQCHMLRIDKRSYLRELRLDPSLTENTLQLVSRRLLETLRDTGICAQRSSVQRVSCYLMQFRPEPECADFQVRLQALKRDIAAKLGLTQETFSRVLGLLSQQGVIHVDGSLIHVADARKLASFSPADCR